VVSPNRNRRTSRSRRLARSWGRGSDRRCGAAGNPPPFRPVPPRVRFFDRTGATTPPNGMGGSLGRFLDEGRWTKTVQDKARGSQVTLCAVNTAPQRGSGTF
jgi:hypothetical protein